MKKLQSWIEAMRLRTLPVSLAGVVMGAGYARRLGDIDVVPLALCFAVAFLAQIASNFANEYYDYVNGLDRKGRIGPRRGVTEGDISPRAMKAATFITLGLACVAGLGLVAYGGLILIAVGVAIILGALAYSTGPYPLSHHGLGEVAVILFFGIVPVNFTCSLVCGEWTTDVLAGSISTGLLIANVLIVNNYRDEADDRAVGKHTLAVILGRRYMPPLYLLNALAAGLLLLGQMPGAQSALPLAIMGLGAIGAVAMSRLRGSALTPLLGMTAVAILILSITFALL